MLDQAFEALKTYDWGADLAPLAPIQEAVSSTHGQPEARQELESRLVAALQSTVSRDAKDYVCRMLAIVGTAAAVPNLATLLSTPEHSHMARFALERIPAPAAAQALRDAIVKLGGSLKIGVISSVGARRDPAAVTTLGGLLHDPDPGVARAAAHALGDIGNTDAAYVLQEAAQSTTGAKAAATDALLTCAESLLAANKSADAATIYHSLAGNPSRLVRLAATRGLLACAGGQG